MTTHHVSDDLLARYAGGNLAEGWSLAVATHLAMCAQCRDRLAAFECIGGALLEEMSPTGPGQTGGADIDASWLAQMTRLDVSQASPIVTPRSATRQLQVAQLPQPLLDYVGADLPAIRWKALGRGAYHLPLCVRDTETSVRLLRIPAGKPVPEHGHGGRELTLVIDGAFTDGERLFRRGDIEDANEDLVHQPIATPDQDCICLAVTDAPLRFSSWIVRLVQPVLRI